MYCEAVYKNEACRIFLFGGRKSGPDDRDHLLVLNHLLYLVIILICSNYNIVCLSFAIQEVFSIT
jgi:hypothetical protein